jgi:hypothetical protein
MAAAHTFAMLNVPHAAYVPVAVATRYSVASGRGTPPRPLPITGLVSVYVPVGLPVHAPLPAVKVAALVPLNQMAPNRISSA